MPHAYEYFIIILYFTITKSWKQPKCPSVDEWIKKLWYIYTMEYYAAERKKKFLPFVTAWMELEITMLSEISQTVNRVEEDEAGGTGRYIMQVIDHAEVWGFYQKGMESHRRD